MLKEGDEVAVKKALDALEPKGDQSKLPWDVANIRWTMKDGFSGEPDLKKASDAERAKLGRDYDDAETLINKLKQTNFKDFEPLLLEGKLHKLRADLAEAEGAAAAAESEKDAPANAARGERNLAVAAYNEALNLKAGAAAVEPLVELYTVLKDVTALEKLRAMDPVLLGNADVGRLSVNASLRINDLDQAEVLAAKIINADPNNLDVQVLQASLLGKKKPKEAEALLRKFAETHPLSSNAWQALLLAQSSLGMKDEAKQTVERIQRNDLKFDRPEILFAQAYRIIGDRVKADEQFQSALKKYPKDKLLKRVAASYYVQTERFAEAADVIRPVLDEIPPPDWAERMQALILSSRGDSESAWKEALDLIGPEPRLTDTPDDRFVRAQVYARGGTDERIDKSIEILDKLSQDYPLAEVYQVNLAMLYERTGKLDKALELAKKLADKREDSESFQRLIRILLAQNKPEPALEEARKFSKTFSDDANSVAFEARSLFALKRDKEAVDLLLKSYKDHETKPVAEAFARTATRLLAEFEHTDEAKALAAQASKRWPSVSLDLATELGGKKKLDEAFNILSENANAGELKDRAWLRIRSPSNTGLSRKTSSRA